MRNTAQYLDLLRTCVDHLNENLSLLEEAAAAIYAAPKVLCMGVGKSGFIASKVSASLTSISVDSRYLHPGDALHGDVGCVKKDDIALVFSKSGNSDEISALLPTLLKREVTLIAVTNRLDSRLAQSAKLVLPISVKHEGDLHNLLPLISTDISLVIGNMIVSEIARLRDLQPEQFALNHPGGQLGFAAGRTLSSLESWRTRCPFVNVGTPLMQAMIEESKYKAGMVCVLNEGGFLIGVVTDGDIRRALVSGIDFQRSVVDDLMNTSPVTVSVSQSLTEALSVMESSSNKVFSAPILSDDCVCLGVVVIHDLIRTH